jgi:hypothetical protein
MATGFAFFPETIAGAGKEVHFASTLSLLERFGIQVTQHQHVAGFMVLYDSRYEPTKFFERQFHKSLLK